MVVAHSTGTMYIYFNVRIALWELSDDIFKLGFSRAFDETVDGDTENSMCTEYCLVLAFFFRGNQKVFIKFML